MAQIAKRAEPGELSALANAIGIWMNEHSASPFKTLFERYMGMGYTEAQIQSALRELVDADCIEKVAFQ